MRIPRSERADSSTASMKARCSGERSVSSARPVMPMMPFIGVRISWLMFARKSLLSRAADSAVSFARTRRSCACRSSVMSLPIRVRRILVDDGHGSPTDQPGLPVRRRDVRLEGARCVTSLGREPPR